MDIVEFYKTHNVPKNFKYLDYISKLDSFDEFYEPYCKNNNVSNSQKAYFHCFKYSRCIYVKPRQGLCNRLLLLDSLYALAKQCNFVHIFICWAKTEGFSSETFESIFDINELPDNISFVDEKEYQACTKHLFVLDKYFAQNKETLEYEIYEYNSKQDLFKQIEMQSFCVDTWASIDWIFELNLKHRYELLKHYIKPSKDIQLDLQRYSVDREYIGLHIRKGDAFLSGETNYRESKAQGFLKVVEYYDDKKIFLSTDDEDIQTHYCDNYSNIVVSQKKFVDKNITISDCKPLQKEAAIDLFLLSRTSKIYGSYWSTFNYVASIIGQNENIQLRKEFSIKRYRNITAICAIKNRFNIIKSSIHSWLQQEDIKEIIIVDYDSNDFDKHYIENLHKKIKVITVENQPYFHLSKAYNIAIENASNEQILKLDVDYFLNPYYQLSDWIHTNLETNVLTGDWREKTKDAGMGFIEHLNGFMFCNKSNLIKAGMYQGNQYGYGYDDCDLYSRLEKIGINRQTLQFKENFVPIFHIPHDDHHRSKNYQNKNIKQSLLKNQKQALK